MEKEILNQIILINLIEHNLNTDYVLVQLFGRFGLGSYYNITLDHLINELYIISVNENQTINKYALTKEGENFIQNHPLFLFENEIKEKINNFDLFKKLVIE